MVVHFLVDSWSESLPRPLFSSRVSPRTCRALTSSSWHDVALNCSRSLFLRSSLSLLVAPSLYLEFVLYTLRICLVSNLGPGVFQPLAGQYPGQRNRKET